VAGYQARDIGAADIGEPLAQDDIVAEVVDADTNGVEAARFGGAGLSGAPPSRKMGILGILDRSMFGSY
jgi:hypothetical protein